MPYSGSGNFTVANSFTPNTTISSSLMNTTLADIAAGLSNALTRDNQAGMNAPLRLADGSVTLPGMQFGSDLNTGFRRSGADEMRWVGGGQDRMYIDATGKAWFLGDVTIIGDLDAAGLGGTLPITGGAMSGVLTINDLLTAALATKTDDGAYLYIRNQNGGPAAIRFGSVGVGAFWLGMDTDGRLKVGGVGGLVHRVFHEGQPPTIANISGLQTAIDGKAPLVHLHTIAQVTSLQAALDAKVGLEDSTSATETSYELGTTLLAKSNAPYDRGSNQNQVLPVSIGTGGGIGPNVNGAGATLAGTWRCRGGFDVAVGEGSSSVFLMQRVA